MGLHRLLSRILLRNKIGDHGSSSSLSSSPSAAQAPKGGAVQNELELSREQTGGSKAKQGRELQIKMDAARTPEHDLGI